MDRHRKVYFIAEQISTGRRFPLYQTIGEGYIPEDPHILDEYDDLRIIATYNKDEYKGKDEPETKGNYHIS